MGAEEGRRLAAVWFADIVGYTTLSDQNEDVALKLVAELQAISDREVAGRSGRVVKFVGDAVLAVFESAGSAVESALALMAAFNATEEAQKIGATLRVGVHVGEIHTAADGDIYGDGVNTASRIQGAAGPGQVFLSPFAVESVRHTASLRTESVGTRRLKGLSRPMELFVVGLAEAGDPREVTFQAPFHPEPGKPLRMGQVIAVGLLAGLAGLVGIGIVTGAGPFASDSAPDGVEAGNALTLGKEAYFRGEYEGAIEDLTRSLELSGSLLQKRQSLRYLARTHVILQDSAAALRTLDELLATEPPLAVLIPSLEDSTLMDLYFEARRETNRIRGGGEISLPLRQIMVFDFQVFSSGVEMDTEGMKEDLGYVVALMMETELQMQGLPTSSVHEMSFEAGGYDAYLDMDSTLVAMVGEGPSHLLTGSVAINRTGALVSAWLYEMETGRLILSQQVTGTQEDLLMKLPEDLAARLGAALPGGQP